MVRKECDSRSATEDLIGEMMNGRGAAGGKGLQ